MGLINALAVNQDFFNALNRTAETAPGGWLIPFVLVMSVIGVIIGVFLGLHVVYLGIWAERRVSARMQDRVGPNRVGLWGLLQGIADGIKLIGKEYVEPAGADSFFFKFSPALVMGGAFAGYCALPFSHTLVVADFNIALFFILAITSTETIGVIMGGWASNNKWSLYGAIREAIQVVSYEIPLALSLMIGIIMYGTMSLMDIQDAQSGTGIMSILGWGFFRSPFMVAGALLFYIAGLASCKRTPFDLPEGESELVAGYHTEYPGMAFGMFFFAEYASMYLIGLVMVVVYFGGAHLFGLEQYGFSIPLDKITEKLTLGKFVIHGSIPIQASFFTLILKSWVPYFVMIQLRWTLPRYRLDQVIDICYKILLPFALVCLVGQAAWSLGGLDNWAFDILKYFDFDTTKANVLDAVINATR